MKRGQQACPARSADLAGSADGAFALVYFFDDLWRALGPGIESTSPIAETAQPDGAKPNIPAAVAEKGALATNLLGMSFLGRLETFQRTGS
ncbi:MAG: hypothetical protein ACREDO_04355 [Methyloceanibacter sp.]